jgi:pimeloyl-ACP methyl ester carboxylesterase
MIPSARVAHRNARQRRVRAAVLLGTLTVGALAAHPSTADAMSTPTGSPKPTIVLVHGPWVDGSSWRRVVRRLQADGYTVVAPPTPLRSLSGDSAYLNTFLEAIDGPIVLVGHSYGASVVANAATGDPDIRALVFVNGLVPAEGETVAELAGPESALSVSDSTVIFDFVTDIHAPTGESDVYLKQATFLESFATGLDESKAKALWATQRPVALAALNEPSGTAASETIPSWYLIGTHDIVIPPDAQKTMAIKAGSTVERFAAGHLGLITDPSPVVRAIKVAAHATR